MGPKKKAKKGDGDGDESTEKVFRLYKRKCAEEGIPVVKRLEEKFLELREEELDLTHLHVIDEIGDVGTRAILDAMRDVDYQHCTAVSFLKTNCQDEGCRAIVQFLEKVHTVTILEVEESQLTPLSCEFISRILIPDSLCPLQELKLDHNMLGAAGVEALAVGLRANSTLKRLSLAYCGIEEDAAFGLINILTTKFTAITHLILQGNRLRNTGIKQILPMFKLNESLTHLNLADNDFGQDKEAIAVLCDTMMARDKIDSYDLRFNGIYDEECIQLTDVLKGAQHILKFEVSQKMETFNYLALQDALKTHKPKKKKKGKKKGKKKAK